MSYTALVGMAFICAASSVPPLLMVTCEALGRTRLYCPASILTVPPLMTSPPVLEFTRLRSIVPGPSLISAAIPANRPLMTRSSAAAPSSTVTVNGRLIVIRAATVAGSDEACVTSVLGLWYQSRPVPPVSLWYGFSVPPLMTMCGMFASAECPNTLWLSPVTVPPALMVRAPVPTVLTELLSPYSWSTPFSTTVPPW
ncbi:MAG: hypothetical protein BWX88_05216 [Planctomycetes bacterium ADurb.Bin126]|nr:MAG: hypothetical protein BWX88_05216 [Planctomycetes bacterium ADurb.Bin126]